MKTALEPRLRFGHDAADGFGPGKADLLQFIAQTGSIRAAADRMKMSYNRAWILVRAVNRLFSKPLVSSVRGGGSGGGATLTATGREVLERYRRMERACQKAARADWKAIERLLR